MYGQLSVRSPLEGDRSPLVNMQYLFKAVLTRIHEKSVFDLGPIVSPSESPPTQESMTRNIRTTSHSYFPSGSSSSNSSSCVASVGKVQLDTNTAPLS
jgi:hypothetical protein